MGKTLGTATDKYNKTVTALVGKQGLLARSSVSGARRRTPGAICRPPTPQHPNVEHDRLAVLEEERAPRLAAVDKEKGGQGPA
jgi:DNA recombination protein RmuC